MEVFFTTKRFSYSGHVSTNLKFILLYFSEIIFHLAVNRVRTIVKPRSVVAFSFLAARPSVCPCNSCRKKCLYVFYCSARHVRMYVPGVPLVSTFNALQWPPCCRVVTVPTVPLSSMI